MTNFIHDEDCTNNLPIPVTSNSKPTNVHQFLTHIILSLGMYDTEIDALTNSTIRKCLQKSQLIGNEVDTESLHEYSNHLTRRYIEEQVVNFPIFLSAAETYIVMAKKIFDDAIINNGLTMNELPPFTMSALCMVKTAEN